MSTAPDPIARIEAQTKLDNLALKADLDNLDATLNKLFNVTAPEIKDITTPEELKSLIAAVEKGTADNNQLAKFIDVANRILNKLG